MMSETCATSSRAATRGSTFFDARGRGRENRVIAAGEADDERRQRLGELMAIERSVGDEHFVDARELGRSLGRRADALAGDENMHAAADLQRRRQRLGGGGGERGPVAFPRR